MSRSPPLKRRVAAWKRACFGLALAVTGIPALHSAQSHPVPLERDFVVRHWRQEHGLPDNRVLALLPARSGFLWLGTRKGVSRFDGDRFRTWSRSTHDAFRSEECRALAEDRDGGIWVGTTDGLIQLADPPVRYDPADIQCDVAGSRVTLRNTVWSLHASETGEQCVGTETGLLTRSPDGTWTREDTRETAEFTAITGFAPLPDGSLLVGTLHQLFRRERPGAPWVKELEGDNDRATRCVHGLVRAAGDVPCALVGSWFDATGRLLRRGKQGWQVMLERDFNNFSNPLFLAADARGGVWFPVGAQVLGRWRDGHLTEYSLPSFLGNDVIRCLAEDAQGSLWAGTARNGLLCLEPRRIRTLTPEDGLPDPKTWALLQASDGALWAGTDAGAVRFHRVDGGGFADAARRAPGKIRALAEDATGDIWIGTSSGVHRWNGRELQRVEFEGEPHRHKIRVLCPARDGSMWIGTAQGLHRLGPDGTNAWSVAHGLPHENVCAILEDRRQNIWIGTDGGGLTRLSSAGFERYDETRGLSSARVWALHEDEEGVLWIGTDRGLNLLRHDRLAAVTTRHGLPDNLVNGVASDRHGALWVGHDRGIYRADRRELLDAAEGRRDQVRCIVYSEHDGLPNSEVNGQVSCPSVLGLRDGRIAFATMRGVALLDPTDLPDLTQGPSVHLEELRAGGQRLFPQPPSGCGLGTTPITAPEDAATLRVHISPRQRSVVDLRYTAVAFRAPDQTRFRFRLLGLSPDWVEAGALRQATYPSLKPGSYTFEVIAVNHQGYWSASPARLDFVVEPAWHERPAVWLAGLLLLGAAAVSGVRWRLREVRRLARLQQQATLAGYRARLAKDLHDGLGASLTEITLLSGLGRPEPLPPEVAQRFDRLAHSTHQALHSLRDLIWTTTPRADSLEALVSRICECTERLVDAADLRCTLDFPPELPPVTLGPDLRTDLVFAANEALHNAVRHAHAARITVRFRIEKRRLLIEIEDDGQGFDATEVERRAFPAGHGLGLPGLRERLAAHGGTCEIQTGPGRGTKVTLCVPLPSAGGR